MILILSVLCLFSCSNLNFTNRYKGKEEDEKKRYQLTKDIWNSKLDRIRKTISEDREIIFMKAKAKTKSGNDKKAFIPIFEAVKRKKVDSFKVLLEEYIKHEFDFIETKDKVAGKKYTLLEYVIKSRCKGMFDLIESDDKYDLKVAKSLLEIEGWEDFLEKIYEKLGSEDCHKAALEERDKELKEELEKGMKYDVKDRRGNSLLSYIVHSGNMDIFKEAISTFDSIEEILSADENIINTVINLDNSDYLDILIDKGLNPEDVSVINIIKSNSHRCLGLAIKHGCNLGKKIQHNKELECEVEEIPLMIAVEEGYDECFEILVKEVKDVNEGIFEDMEYGKNSLIVASEKGRLDYLKKLIKAGADVNRRYDGDTYFGEYGTTPLVAALNNYEENSFDVIKALIKAGADVDKKGEKGRTALMLALERRASLEIIDLLLEAGADVNAEDTFGRTALMYLLYDGGLISGYFSRYCFHNSLQYKEGKLKEVVQKLLDREADVNKEDKVGCTPLMHAASLKGDKNEIVEMLIEAGAKVDSFMEIYSSEYIKLALDKRKKISFFHLLNFCHSDESEIKRGRKAHLLMMFHKGRECTPLMIAAMEGNKKCLETLIERGANINYKTGRNSFTALMLATINAQEDCLKTLLEKGALITQTSFPFAIEENLHSFSIAKKYEHKRILFILLFAIKNNEDIIENSNEW